jgi:hypothetical protein
MDAPSTWPAEPCPPPDVVVPPPPPCPPPCELLQALLAAAAPPLFIWIEVQVELELLALPLVAFPPVVLLETLALPVEAFWLFLFVTLTLLWLVTDVRVYEFIVIGEFGPLVWALLDPPDGKDEMLEMPTLVIVVLLLEALPLVALPPVVLLDTVAFPLDADW